MLQIRKLACYNRQLQCLCRLPKNLWQSWQYTGVDYVKVRHKSTTKKPLEGPLQQENSSFTEDFSSLSESYINQDSILCYDGDQIQRVVKEQPSPKQLEKEIDTADFSELYKRYGEGSVSSSENTENSSISILPLNDVLKTLQEEHFKKYPSGGQEKRQERTQVPSDSNIDREQKTNSKATNSKKGKDKNFHQKSGTSLSKKKIVIIKGKNDNNKNKIDKINEIPRNQNQVKPLTGTLHGLSDEGKKLLDLSKKSGKEAEKKENTESRIREILLKEFNGIQKKKSASTMYRESKLGIQMLSSPLYEQLFSSVTPKEEQEIEDDLERSKEHLIAQGLWGKEPSVVPDFDFKLPPLKDRELDQHFRIIAEEQCAPYKDLLNQLVGADIPSFPKKWQFMPGWTRYNPNGSFTAVDYPDCKALVFDVEVCVEEGKGPTLATAVSDKYWYSWCSNLLAEDQREGTEEVLYNDLIPLESSKEAGFNPDKSMPRVIIGHNVSYDRLRVCEQYQVEGTPLRFVDTMSLHIAVSGLISEQRAMMLKNKNADKKVKLPWMFVGCQNSLNEVFKFYCHTNEELKKDIRDVFVKGNIVEIREDFQNLMSYCASDVKATHMVLVKLLPLFFERFPHPVSFAGMLEMGTTFLPVTQNWHKYISAAESEFHRMERLLNEELVKQARGALKYVDNKEYENDPWLWSLDWSVPKGRVKKLPGYPNWYRKLCAHTGEREGTPEPENMSTSLQVVPRLLRLTWNGLPLHYERKYGWGYLKPIYDNVNEIPHQKTTLDSNSVYQTFPVNALYKMYAGQKFDIESFLKDKENKTNDLPETEQDWLSLLSESDSDVKVCEKKKSINQNQKKKDEERGYDIGIPGVVFIPLPHKDGPGNRVGNPLAKDFLLKIEDKTLSSYFGDIAELVLKTSKSLSYWRNNRDRILSQMVIWNDQNDKTGKEISEANEKKECRTGIILPMVVTAGTITRRAVEPTWMTASNAYVDRIGSELKAMVEAPPGYNFVGADVDSQELWIAAVLGDAYFSGEHGATALGWMTLQGKKSDGSDMHSRTANTAGISRDHAKVINYGRIYGAGLRFIQRLLRQFNPKLSEEETQQRATQLFATTKGQKGWYLNKMGQNLALELNYPISGEALDRKEINKLLRQARYNNIEASFYDVVDGPAVWVGGSESYMFNCLEAIARSEEPRTPVLGARVTRALEAKYVDDQYMTSRVNWVVQSSAVDYLHIMLVSMRWLFQEYNIRGRFCISIHDEVRYLVATEDSHRAALALQITNLLTRSLFAQKLGFKDLPQSVAFFSAVDIDYVLRKEPHLDCVTPSNPEGLNKGYGIPPGEALDMQKILEVTSGILEKNGEDAR
ncbi:DNA polymerase subunit gamma-1-like [Penaeus indicus]|uniref:DNA polymerase subunit gamma-1-like n=1 Tax=Penaeus indicus TaxID=29960 RepID=UPI00300C3977